MEEDVVEIDPAFDAVELDRVGLVGNADSRIEDFEDPLATGHGALELRVLHDQVADGVEEAGNVKGKGRQHGKEVGNVDGARVDRPEAADDDYGRGGDRDRQLEDRHHGGTEEGGLV